MHYRKLSELKKLENNPRIIMDAQFQTLVESIRNNLDYFEARPLILSDRTGELRIIAGNQRYEAAKVIGLEEVPTFLISDLTLEREREITIRDNVSNGEWEMSVLANEWSDLPLNEWGVSLPEDWLNQPDELPEEGEYNGEPPAEPVTVLGDLYELNEHRVHCADSTDSEAVAKLMEGKKADITLSSPPYNAGRTPNGNEQKYENDSDNKTQNDYLSLIEQTTKIALLFSEYSFINIQSLSGNKFALIDYLSLFKEQFCDYIIWDKMGAEPAMGYNILNSRFEFVYVFGKEAKRCIGVKPFRGTLENIVYIKSRQDKEFAWIHKATYPIEFAAHFIESFSNDSVLDLFAGTGTTLIAAHQLGRTFYGQELDPKYVDVIVTRWLQCMRTNNLPYQVKRNGVLLTEAELSAFITDTVRMQ